MNQQELKDKALQMLCEEHLWKENEWDAFEYKGEHYAITRLEKGWELSNTYNKKKVYPTLGRLFGSFFRHLGIKY